MALGFRGSSEQQESGFFRRLAFHAEGEPGLSENCRMLREMQQYGGMISDWYNELIGQLREHGVTSNEISRLIHRGLNDGGLPPIVHAGAVGHVDYRKGVYQRVVDITRLDIGLTPHRLPDEREITLVAMLPREGFLPQSAFDQLVIDEEMEAQYDNRVLKRWHQEMRAICEWIDVPDNPEASVVEY